MRKQIPPERASSCSTPTLAPILVALRVACTLQRDFPAAPEEVRQSPEHAGDRRRGHRVRAIAHREMGDERRDEVDGEAGVGPLLEPRRHRRVDQRHAEELGQRELHSE